mgnify:CR=1 FL=1
MTGKWVYGAILVLSVLHLLALAYAYRNRPDAGGDEREGRDAAGRGATGVDGETTDHAHGEDVECPECGAVNGRDYRFCRRCVAELPGEMSVLEQSSRATSRRTL